MIRGAVNGAGLIAIAAMLSITAICSAQETVNHPQPVSRNVENSNLYLKIQLNNSPKFSKLRPGDSVQGALARDVYAGDRKLFSAGDHVRLEVDHMEKRRRAIDDHWPWVVKAFAPRHENYPVFKSAMISGGEGESSLPVSVLSISRKREVQAQSKKKKSGAGQSGRSGEVEVSRSGGVYGPSKLAAPVMVLEGFEDESGAQSSSREQNEAAENDIRRMQTLPVGTACKILLLGNVSASKSKAGDTVEARLLEPVMSEGAVAIPAGTLVEGRVVRKTPPRWGSRAGSLYLAFTGMTLPGGNAMPISASLTGAELDRRSHTKIDNEGQLRGEHPGKAWMAINIGVTAGLAKEVDDSTQLVIEAIISTATDASTAGTARIVSSCISGLFMITRHGRDVVLPRFTEINIAFDRPVSVSKKMESAAADLRESSSP